MARTYTDRLRLDPFKLAPQHGEEERRQTLLSLATVFITSQASSGDSVKCTGVHLGDGLVLTAGHCAITKGALGYEAHEALTVHFGCNRVEGDNPTSLGRDAVCVSEGARMVTSGVQDDLDFALLQTKVPEAFADTWVPFDGGAEDAWNAAGTELEIYVFAQGEKVRIADVHCQVYGGECRGGSQDGRVHGCDTQPSSSGGLVAFRRGKGVAGIHVGSNEQAWKVDSDGLQRGRKWVSDFKNCAIPVGVIGDYLDRGETEVVQSRIRWAGNGD